MYFYVIGDMLFKNDSELGELRAKYEHASPSDKSKITREKTRVEIKIHNQAIIRQYAELIRYYVLNGIGFT